MSGYYAANPHYAAPDHSEAKERFARCEERAGALFAAATVAQTTVFHAAMSDLRGLSAPRYDRSRDAAKAAFERSTEAARELCEITMQELMTAGEISDATYDAWELLDLPSYEEALLDATKARKLFDASKGGNVRGITEDHRYALAEVIWAAERTYRAVTDAVSVAVLEAAE
jgi:hypothetical protein